MATNAEIEAQVKAIIASKLSLPNLELTTEEVLLIREYFKIRNNTSKQPCRTMLLEFCYEIANEIKQKTNGNK